MDAAEAAVIRQNTRVDPAVVRAAARDKVKQHIAIKEAAEKAQQAIASAIKAEQDKEAEDAKAIELTTTSAEAKAKQANETADADVVTEARTLAWTVLLKDLDPDPKIWQPKLKKMFLSFKQGEEEIDIHDLGAGLKVIISTKINYNTTATEKVIFSSRTPCLSLDIFLLL